MVYTEHHAATLERIAELILQLALDVALRAAQRKLVYAAFECDALTVLPAQLRGTCNSLPHAKTHL